MRVLRDLPNESFSISLGHRVFWLDLNAGIDALLEAAFLFAHLLDAAQSLSAGIYHLRIHKFVFPITIIGSAARSKRKHLPNLRRNRRNAWKHRIQQVNAVRQWNVWHGKTLNRRIQI